LIEKDIAEKLTDDTITGLSEFNLAIRVDSCEVAVPELRKSDDQLEPRISGPLLAFGLWLIDVDLSVSFKV
jgi:hypothetical protein